MMSIRETDKLTHDGHTGETAAKSVISRWLKAGVSALIPVILLSLSLFSCRQAADGNTQSERFTDTAVTEPSDVTGVSDATDTPDATEPDTETLNLNGGDTQEGYTRAQEPDTENEKEDETLDELARMAPVFSVPGGYCDSSVTVSISLPDEAAGNVIRYTTDGTVPNARSKKVNGDLTLLSSGSDTVIIRAATFDKNGKILSDVITNTYTKDKVRMAYTVYITVDEENLNHIIRHASETIEIPAHLEMLSSDGAPIINQDCGLRLFGGSSRGLAQKSFKLIARKDGTFGEDQPFAGKGTFDYALFPGRKILAGKNAGKVLGKYDSIVLRNGGNDSLLHNSVDPDDATILRDGIVNNFAATWAPNVSAAYSVPVSVYVNGEYYGILDMKENLNEDYVKRLYGVSDDDVTIVKSELDTSRHCDEHSNGGACRFDNVWFFYETDDSEKSAAALREWTELCQKAISAVNATGKAYDDVFAEISAKVDLESFKEYMALGLFMCNTDWPHNNVKLWKYTGDPIEGVGITDGKWRFMTRDNDMDMGRYSSPDVLPELNNNFDVDTFWRCLGNYVKGYEKLYDNDGLTRLYPDSLYLQGLLAFCLKNDSFRQAFDEYCRVLASKDAQTALMAGYKAFYAQAEKDIDRHLAEWTPRVSKRTWSKACKRIETFIDKRPAKFLSYLDTMMKMYS